MGALTSRYQCGPSWLRSALLAAGLAGLTCLGCGESLPEVRVLSGERYEVQLQCDGQLTLKRGGDSLLVFPRDAWQLGVVDALDDSINYDPYRLYEPLALYDLPAELHWLAPQSAHFADAEAESGELLLRLEYAEGIGADLRLHMPDEGRFEVQWTPTGERVAFMRVHAPAGADEAYYGLGEHFDSVDQRGKVRAMQLEVDNALESGYNEAHVPIPFVTSTRGWGLFVDSARPAAFALAHDERQRIEAAFATGVASSSEGLAMQLFAAEHPLDVTRHYYEATGYPGLPARWALGPLIWRDENENQAQVESDAQQLRDLDLATNGLWIDRPYATAVNSFDFEAQLFPDPPQMFAHLKALGLAVGLWHTPYLDEEAAATKALHEHAESQGFYPPETGLVVNSWGRPLDFTNAAATSWWQQQLADYIQLGVVGFKLDYAEDVVVGLFENRIPWKFADGSDERTMHADYQRHYHRAYAELLPKDGGLLLCRAGTIGDQRNGPIIWPGDLDANFAKHGETVSDPNGDYVAVGGLPASLIAGLTLGPSGFPFYGADTGGYRHAPTDNETFSRWFEQTALSTVMQIGTGANDVAWELGGSNGFDAAMLDRYRLYTRLHLRLFPYLWSYAQRLREDGRPIQRALGLAHPELGEHPDDIYLLGDSLLVAPVVERGAVARQVLFPSGRWVHWFTGEQYDGPGWFEVGAPIGRLPLFIAEGGLIPMLRPTIDTLLPATAADVDSYADDHGLVYVRGVVGGTTAFELFDGAQIGMEIAPESNNGTVTYASGAEFSSGVMFELHASEPEALSVGAAPGMPIAAATSVAALDGVADGWFYDAAAGKLWIKLSDQTQAHITWS